MTRLEKFLRIGVINTLRFNYKYFGFAGLFELPVILSRNVKIISLKGTVLCKSRRGGVQIGFSDLGIVDERMQRCIWENNGCVVFHGTANLGKAIRISNSGTIEFGDKAAFTGNTQIICKSKIVFGKDCLVSWECLIMDTDWHPIYQMNENNSVINPDKPIKIGDHVWIGCKCTLLKGTAIPDNCIVASGSKLSRTLTKKNVIYGDKGTVISRDVVW